MEAQTGAEFSPECLVGALISDLNWGELVLHHSQHTVRLQADQADGEDGGEVRLPATLVLQHKERLSTSARVNHRTDHLELLDCFLETLPGEQSAPAPQFAVSDPTEAPYDESPGYEGQGHDGEDPVKQSLQSDPPRTRL